MPKKMCERFYTLSIMAKRTKRSKEFKFKIALEAIKGDKQIAEIAKDHDIHPQQITQ
jgi:transposase-like protein